ncbi:MAG: universal stress protein [Betaproteobacteria bacterium]|nr:universal stress protein [Betaproteobacteria bacterium]
MPDHNKVTACVDHSRFADYVTDYGAWAAQRMGTLLDLLHVLDRHPETAASSSDHSGAIGMGAQDDLLRELAESERQTLLSARERGRTLLARLRQRALDAGATEVDIRQRLGELTQTLVEQAPAIGLLVLGRRGASAEQSGRDIGRHVEAIVRALHIPILTVTDAFTPPQRVLIAYDGGSMTRRAVEWVGAQPLLAGLDITVCMASTPSAQTEKALDWARQTLQSRGMTAQALARAGDPESVISAVLKEQNIDLLIMGAYSHSPVRKLLLGSKTADLLRASTIPTLLLR